MAHRNQHVVGMSRILQEGVWDEASWVHPDGQEAWLDDSGCWLPAFRNGHFWAYNSLFLGFA